VRAGIRASAGRLPERLEEIVDAWANAPAPVLSSPASLWSARSFCAGPRRSSKIGHIRRRSAASRGKPLAQVIELPLNARSRAVLGLPVAKAACPPASNVRLSSIAAVGPTGAEDENP
jgi:hypothetical protein